MKLNNKGFAISAILYTLLILFTLTLISLIAGLNSRNKMLEKSIESMEKKYNWDCIDETKDSNISYLPTTEKRGKYIFKGTNEEGNEIKCTGTSCQRYLSGKITIPMDRLIMLAKLYDIDIDELCGKEDNKNLIKN